MASVRIPQSQLSELPARRQRTNQSDLLFQVLANNPFAQALNEVGPEITTALAKRAALKKQGMQLAQLESLSGQTPGSYAGLDPSTATSLASNLIKQRSENFTPEQMNAIAQGDLTQMSGVFPMGVPKEAATISLSGERSKNLGEERAGRRDERLGSAAIAYWKTLETNPVIKTLKQQDVGLSQVDALVPLVQSGNTVASSALGTKMARGMGEVGVLTESDVTRYVESGQLTRKAADKLTRMIRGVPTEATLEEMKQITKVLRDSYDSKIQPLYNDAVERFANNYDISTQEASKRLVIPYTKGKLKTITPNEPVPITPKKVGRFQVEVEQ